jgi:hypothetical protein
MSLCRQRLTSPLRQQMHTAPRVSRSSAARAAQIEIEQRDRSWYVARPGAGPAAMPATRHGVALAPRPTGKLTVASIAFVAVLTAALAARADDLNVAWSAPTGCPDRESVREGLAQRLGRPVTFGPDAPLQLSATIAVQHGGYAMELHTRSPTSSEERQLQARSCNELVRASLVIAALLLGEGPVPPEPAAVSGTAASPAQAPRPWWWFARVGVVGDSGSLTGLSLGPSLGIGLAVHSTRVELSGVYLPAKDLHAPEPNGPTLATLRLAAASLDACQEFFRGPTLAPCFRVEAGQLHGQGQHLQSTLSTNSTWLLVLLGARAGMKLFDALYGSIELSAGLPWNRPTFAIRGVSSVHEVPALIGRVELSLEAHF